MSQCEHGKKRVNSVVYEKLRSSRWLFPFAGIAALAWFLIRVVPKPSRLLYPCQRLATPLASGFVAWLIATVGGTIPSVFVYKLGKTRLKNARYLTAFGLFFVAMALYAGAFIYQSQGTASAYTAPYASAGYDVPEFVPEAVNEPMGVARGVLPGRVVWTFDPASTITTSGDYWYTDENTDPEVVTVMLRNTILQLTGAETLADAWDAIFHNYNSTHDRGDGGYVAGEKIAIKMNMVTCASSEYGRNSMNPSPQVAYALISQLIEDAGVAGADITMYDASSGFGTPIVTKIRSNPAQDYQDVKFVCNGAGMPRSPLPGDPRVAAVPDTLETIMFSDSTIVDYDRTAMPACVSEATYLINVANLKSHNTSGFTLCAKNYFGSIYRPSQLGDGNELGWTPGANPTDPIQNGMAGLHGYMSPFGYGGRWAWKGWEFPPRDMGTYNPFVDLIGYDGLGGKAILQLVDALYAAKEHNNSIAKYQQEPFASDNGWASSLFASIDPIAIDSVCLDFLINEPINPYVFGSLDNYLHEGALANDPPSGWDYHPNGEGTNLPSLGVHEHWNNPDEKKYSRNLGTGDGIELIAVKAPDKPLSLTAVEGTGKLELSWLPGPGPSLGTTTYTVKRRVGGEVEYTVVAEGLTEAVYSDATAPLGQVSTYVVNAANGYGESYQSSPTSATLTTVGVEDNPEPFILAVENYPNPFNSTTRIAFTVPEDGKVRLSVYNLLGQQVAMLADEVMTAGAHSVAWRGTDDSGATVSSGVYLVRLFTESGATTRKITLMY